MSPDVYGLNGGLPVREECRILPLASRFFKYKCAFRLAMCSSFQTRARLPDKIQSMSMKLAEKFQRSDEEFVQATLDQSKAETLIAALSKERLSMSKQSLMTGGLFLVSWLIFCLLPSNGSGRTGFEWPLFLLFGMLTTSETRQTADMKIKILKASLAKAAAARATDEHTL